MTNPPLPNGSNGRDPATGRFITGNSGGPGNPFARRVAALRSLLLEVVTDDDIRTATRTLIEAAKSGDIVATRELLNRTIGKPTDTAQPDRIKIVPLELEREPHVAADAL